MSTSILYKLSIGAIVIAFALTYSLALQMNPYIPFWEFFTSYVLTYIIYAFFIGLLWYVLSYLFLKTNLRKISLIIFQVVYPLFYFYYWMNSDTSILQFAP